MKKETTKYYLAYGSNLNKVQMAVRCPNAKPVGTAVINGYQLLFKGSKTGAYLTIEKSPGKVVPVGVWMVSEEDEKALDRYEGYPDFYYKRNARVKMLNEENKLQVIEAFVYIMHEDREKATPTSYYLKTCIAGYWDFKFNTIHLKKALEISGGEK